MNKLLASFLVCSFITLLSVGQLSAAWAPSNVKKKVASLAFTSDGIEFSIKGQKIAPLSSCNNEFIVERANEDFDLLAAFLLAASANKKRIDFEYDDAVADCQVPVNSVTIY